MLSKQKHKYFTINTPKLLDRLKCESEVKPAEE
jgi:hypothetical protein